LSLYSCALSVALAAATAPRTPCLGRCYRQHVGKKTKYQRSGYAFVRHTGRTPIKGSRSGCMMRLSFDVRKGFFRVWYAAATTESTTKNFG
jgi:hypothetical protein